MKTRSPARSVTPSGQRPCRLDRRVPISCRYLLYLPKGCGKTKKRWPLILFLHGAGERGDDLERVKIHGPPKLAAEGREFPFIIVSPQCPEDYWWSNPVLIALLDDIERRLPVDPARIYLTGLSMGGFGTWNLATEHPGRFAAIAPICGGGHPILAGRLKDVPVWAFHGARDEVVPLSASQSMVDAVKRAGGRPRFTVYPAAGHDSWTATYNNPRLYAWFLKHRTAKA